MSMPVSVPRLAGLFVVLAAVMAFAAIFSDAPAYRQIPPGTGVIKFSFNHSADRAKECRRRTPEELAKLPPNMRAPVVCPRERSPVVVELDIDGVPAARVSADPSGLSSDGASAVYARLPVAAGERELSVRLNDDARQPGFTYHLDRRVTLAPAQVLVIDFDLQRGGISLQ